MKSGTDFNLSAHNTPLPWTSCRELANYDALISRVTLTTVEKNTPTQKIRDIFLHFFGVIVGSTCDGFLRVQNLYAAKHLSRLL
jgi:hypothetical protein